MKLVYSHRYGSNRGAVLMVVVLTLVVLSVALAAVLSLTTHEQRIIARTDAWNAALPAAEAGIEEAMSHLQKVQAGPRGVNGWTASGSSYVMSRHLGNSRYTVGIDSAKAPTIISVGEVWCPSAGRYIERRVQVGTLQWGRFQRGLVARRTVSLGGGFTSDSFNSLDPNLSTNGQYDPAKRGDNGDIASNLSSPNAITMGGGAKIYGQVATGPDGTILMSNGTSIGTTNWVDGGNSGIQTNRYAKDMNVSFPTATAPYTNGATPVSGIIGGTNYKYVLEDGVDYRLSTLKMSLEDKMLVRGKARLLVDQNVHLSGESFVQIEPNASLELYVKQGTISLTGNGTLNLTGNAASLSIIGLPDLKEIGFSANGTFVGTIYAPQTTLKLSGSGNNPRDFAGAGIVNEVEAGGNYRFHYDEALASQSPWNLVINSWGEL